MAFVNAPKDAAFDNASAAGGTVIFRDSGAVSIAAAIALIGIEPWQLDLI